MIKFLKTLGRVAFLTGWLAPVILGLNFWAARGCEETLECSFPFTATATKLFIVAGTWAALALLKIMLWKRAGQPRPGTPRRRA